MDYVEENMRVNLKGVDCTLTADKSKWKEKMCCAWRPHVIVGDEEEQGQDFQYYRGDKYNLCLKFRNGPVPEDNIVASCNKVTKYL